MKFRFLGGKDCPDWLLSQFANYSKLTSVKFKGICNISVKFLTEGFITDEELANYTNASIDLNYLRNITGSLAFIFRHAVGFKCNVADLESECTQLGLPQEHSTMLGRVYGEKYEIMMKAVESDLSKEPCISLLTMQRLDAGYNLTYTKGSEINTAVMSLDVTYKFLNDMKAIRETVLEKLS